MWEVQATITRREGKGVSTRKIPTFWLDDSVHSIRDEVDAWYIASQILNPFGDVLDIKRVIMKID